MLFPDFLRRAPLRGALRTRCAARSAARCARRIFWLQQGKIAGGGNICMLQQLDTAHAKLGAIFLSFATEVWLVNASPRGSDDRDVGCGSPAAGFDRKKSGTKYHS